LTADPDPVYSQHTFSFPWNRFTSRGVEEQLARGVAGSQAEKMKIIYQKPNKMTFYQYCGSGMVYFRSGADLF